MTESEIEKQAEEYASKITGELENNGFFTNEEIRQRYAGIVQGVLYGLAEGRKEACQKILEETEKYGFVYFGTPTINKLKEIIKDLVVTE